MFPRCVPVLCDIQSPCPTEPTYTSYVLGGLLNSGAVVAAPAESGGEQREGRAREATPEDHIDAWAANIDFDNSLR